MSDSSACLTAPLELAKRRNPELASQLGRYASIRESKTQPLAAFRQERFFVNAGECFAVLSGVTGPTSPELRYDIQLQGVPDPARKKPAPEPGTGARSERTELSPEFCPFEQVYLVVTWLRPSDTAKGDIELQLLRRVDPRPTPPPPGPLDSGVPQYGGNCSSYECNEDCASELRACNLDCFRYGRHEMGSDSLCKAACNQAARSCERSCRIPCPR